jgi:signal transduction histidine kinase
MSLPRVLVADDHPLFRAAVLHALRAVVDAEATVEVDSVSALTSALSEHPDVDLVLLDLTMPGARGFSSLVWLRGERPDVPVIVISSNDHPRVIRRAQQFGAAGFIPKSAPVDNIRAAVDVVMEGGTCFPPIAAERSERDAQLAAKLAQLTPQQFRVLLSLVIRQGLAPLSALARQVAARRPGSDAPITLARTPAEVTPLVDALNGLLARVRDALERERRFTADAAHELRTPLAALKVHSQNAARASSAAEREVSLQRMLQGLERTVYLAEQMLAYSRAAAPGDASRQERVALAPLLREATEGIEPRAREQGCRVETVVDPAAAEAAVSGDRQNLLSLVTNLLDNAVRYGPERARVRADLRREGNAVMLSVSDEGPGIPTGLRERVFESYYRIPGTAGSGGGLGLAIVREIAETHGARVAIEDGPGGRGTRVVVRFPAT